MKHEVTAKRLKYAMDLNRIKASGKYNAMTDHDRVSLFLL